MRTHYSLLKKKSGFALAEIVVALFFVTLAIVLIGALFKQVINFSKYSRQVSAVIELRGRTSAVLRDIPGWLEKLRNYPLTAPYFGDCIPNSVSIYSCPPVLDVSGDAEITALAGPLFVNGVSSTPLVDHSGEQIAGTLDAPLYLDSDGRHCTDANASTRCPLQSVGYFMRSNPSPTQNPGAIRFAIKVSRNPNARTSNNQNLPMKPHLMNMEVGNDWSLRIDCPGGSVRLGGICVNPTASCPSGQFAMGVYAEGNPNCTALPDNCTTGFIIDYSTNTPICSPVNPCGQGNILMGFDPQRPTEAICTPLLSRCPSGQIAIGANCTPLPENCDQQITFTNGGFACLTPPPIDVAECNEPTPVLTGYDLRFNPPRPICVANSVAPPPCGDGEASVMTAEGWDCRSISGVATTIGDTFNNLDSEVKMIGPETLPGWTKDLGNDAAYQIQSKIWPVECYHGKQSLGCGYHPARFTISPSAKFSDPALISKTKDTESPGAHGTSRRCMFINGTWRYLNRSSDGKYRYNRPCNMGISYMNMPEVGGTIPYRDLFTRGDANPSPSAVYRFADEPYATGFKQINGGPGRPTTNEVKTYLATTCRDFYLQNPDTGYNGNAICDRYIDALREANSRMNSVIGIRPPSDTSPDNTLSHCKRVDPITNINIWANCGSGCGILVRPRFSVTNSNKVDSIQFLLKWVRNYQPIEDAADNELPTGDPCNGSVTKEHPSKVRFAPMPPMMEVPAEN